MMLPISSFFFVSTEITGCPAAWAATTLALICSNCAFRSGWLAPSCVLRLNWREYSSFVSSSLATVLAQTSWPPSLRAAASLAGLFDTHLSGRLGHPLLAGSGNRATLGHHR